MQPSLGNWPSVRQPSFNGSASGNAPVLQNGQVISYPTHQFPIQRAQQVGLPSGLSSLSANLDPFVQGSLVKIQLHSGLCSAACSTDNSPISFPRARLGRLSVVVGASTDSHRPAWYAFCSYVPTTGPSWWARIFPMFVLPVKQMFYSLNGQKRQVSSDDKDRIAKKRELTSFVNGCFGLDPDADQANFTAICCVLEPWWDVVVSMSSKFNSGSTPDSTWFNSILTELVSVFHPGVCSDYLSVWNGFFDKYLSTFDKYHIQYGRSNHSYMADIQSFLEFCRKCAFNADSWQNFPVELRRLGQFHF
ncbi:hypothetical protein FACS1894113_3260 [Alphaproteobacteria bacterium]|nr:hypothetical protein FACS1894113_3260 [Alphaproteobacteria bacterium]